MECLECGEKIFGRSDKKFCSDGCRNTYNNNQKKDTTNLMRNINNILRKNCRILDEINVDGKAKTTKSKLTALGFDFNYITQEGFGWMNASFQLGLSLLNSDLLKKLKGK